MKIEVVPSRYEDGKVAVFVHHHLRTLDWDFYDSREKKRAKWTIYKKIGLDSKESGRSWIVHETRRGFHAVGEGPEGLPSGDLGMGFDPLYLRLRGKTFCWRVTPKAEGFPAAFGPIATFGAPSEELLSEVKRYLWVARSATSWDLSYKEIGWFYGKLAFSWRGELKWVCQNSRGYLKGTVAPAEMHISEVNILRDVAWDLYK